MRRTMTLSLAALAASLGMAGAQDAMSAYDANDDGHVSAEEFATQMADRFEGYDTDGSGGVNIEEYAEAEFSRYDENADAMLDRYEFESTTTGIDALRNMGQGAPTPGDDVHAAGEVGIDPLQGTGAADDTSAPADASSATDASNDATGSAFAEFDADEDTLLDHDEYKLSLQEAFGMFDANDDDELSQEELQRARLDRYDADGDGRLNESEFRAWVESGGESG